jgi:hypothetical protein
MNKRNEFNDLVRFSGRRTAEPMVSILEDSDVSFKLTNFFTIPGTPWSWSPAAVVIQVADRDFNRAKEMLMEYRKTMGVPFS